MQAGLYEKELSNTNGKGVVPHSVRFVIMENSVIHSKKECHMDIEMIVEGNKAIFNLDGRLNVQTAPELEAAISGAPDGVINYDIDLAKVPYVSSAGLRVFVAADKRAVSLGGIMRLLHPCDEVMDVFDMTGFADVLKIER